ncbi:MAG: hypothetical protein M3R00_01180, partial [Pseudomonadota bacterium]|nr:hypothetical protein [Pseudomonadota bacterium]
MLLKDDIMPEANRNQLVDKFLLEKNGLIGSLTKSDILIVIYERMLLNMSKSIELAKGESGRKDKNLQLNQAKSFYDLAVKTSVRLNSLYDVTNLQMMEKLNSLREELQLLSYNMIDDSEQSDVATFIQKVKILRSLKFNSKATGELIALLRGYDLEPYFSHSEKAVLILTLINQCDPSGKNAKLNKTAWHTQSLLVKASAKSKSVSTFVSYDHLIKVATSLVDNLKSRNESSESLEKLQLLLQSAGSYNADTEKCLLEHPLLCSAIGQSVVTYESMINQLLNNAKILKSVKDIQNEMIARLDCLITYFHFYPNKFNDEMRTRCEYTIFERFRLKQPIVQLIEQGVKNHESNTTSKSMMSAFFSSASKVGDQACQKLKELLN